MARSRATSYVRMKTHASIEEAETYRDLVALLRTSPVPPAEILANLSLYLTRSALSHVLFMTDIYRAALNIHGVIMEFGNRWGRNLALFSTLRNIFEPHNYSRRIVGFDTFSGFAAVAPQDGSDSAVQIGGLSVSTDALDHLNAVLRLHERLGPRAHLRRFKTVKGDVQQTLPAYLAAHPETIVSLAYFDMDLYQPTKTALETIIPYLVKGSIVGFDEVCVTEFPGETVALLEVLASPRPTLVRSPYSGNQCYVVF